MKLKTVGKNPNKPMIALEEEGKKIWYFAEKQAYDNAKANLKEGDEIEIKIAEQEKDGLKIITFIKKAGVVVTPSANDNSPKCTECGYALKDANYTKCYICNQKAKNDNTVKNFSSDSPKCIDCGKVLKDSKYKKCYTCNQKNPVKQEKSSFDGELSKRQTIAHAVSRSLMTLQGRVDRNDICEIIDMLWAKFSEKLK